MSKLLAVAVVALAVAPWGSNCEAHEGLERSLIGKTEPAGFRRKLKAQEQSLAGEMTPELQLLQGGSLTREVGASSGRNLKLRGGHFGRKLKQRFGGSRALKMNPQAGIGSGRKLKAAAMNYKGYAGGRRLSGVVGRAGRRLSGRVTA